MPAAVKRRTAPLLQCVDQLMSEQFASVWVVGSVASLSEDDGGGGALVGVDAHVAEVDPQVVFHLLADTRAERCAR